MWPSTSHRVTWSTNRIFKLTTGWTTLVHSMLITHAFRIIHFAVEEVMTSVYFASLTRALIACRSLLIGGHVKHLHTFSVFVMSCSSLAVRRGGFGYDWKKSGCIYYFNNFLLVEQLENDHWMQLGNSVSHFQTVSPCVVLGSVCESVCLFVSQLDSQPASLLAC